MSIEIETPHILVAGRMIFENGPLIFAGAEVGFDPGILVYAGIFLNHFGGALRDRPHPPRRADRGVALQRPPGRRRLGLPRPPRRHDRVPSQRHGRHRRRWRPARELPDGVLERRLRQLQRAHRLRYPVRRPRRSSSSGRPTSGPRPSPDGEQARYQGHGQLAVTFHSVQIASADMLHQQRLRGRLRVRLPGFARLPLERQRRPADRARALRRGRVPDPADAPPRRHPAAGRAGRALAREPGRARARRARGPVVHRRRAASGRSRIQVEGVGGAPQLVLADPKGRIYRADHDAGHRAAGRRRRLLERVPAKGHDHAAARREAASRASGPSRRCRARRRSTPSPAARCSRR